MDKLSMLQKLAAAFPKVQVGAGTIAVYLEDLADIPDANLEFAIKKYRQTGTFFPSIAELRKTATEYEDRKNATAVPTWDEVESEIRKAIHSCGINNPPTWSHPLVKELMQNRWRTFCEMLISEETKVFAQTRMVYESMQARAKEQRATITALKTLPIQTQKKLEVNKYIQQICKKSEVIGDLKAPQVNSLPPRK